MLLSLFACVVGESSLQSSQELNILSSLEKIENTATELETIATDLESEVDQVRRNIQNGADPQEQKRILSEKIERLKAKKSRLRKEREELEAAIQVPAPPPLDEDAAELKDN